MTPGLSLGAEGWSMRPGWWQRDEDAAEVVMLVTGPPYSVVGAERYGPVDLAVTLAGALGIHLDFGHVYRVGLCGVVMAIAGAVEVVDPDGAAAGVLLPLSSRLWLSSAGVLDPALGWDQQVRRLTDLLVEHHRRHRAREDRRTLAELEARAAKWDGVRRVVERRRR